MIRSVIKLLELVHWVFDRRPVWGGDSGQGHIRTVDEKDENGDQTDSGTEHAETNDASAAEIQFLYDIAPQESAPASCGYNHVTWKNGQRRKQRITQ